MTNPLPNYGKKGVVVLLSSKVTHVFFGTDLLVSATVVLHDVASGKTYGPSIYENISMLVVFLAYYDINY